MAALSKLLKKSLTIEETKEIVWKILEGSKIIDNKN